MPNARLKRMAAILLPTMAVMCALPLGAASAHSRHGRDCGLHRVVVSGEVSAAAASGASSFTANVWSVRVSEIRLSDDSRYLDDPGIAAACAAATGTTTSTSTTATSGSTTGTATCPAGTSATPAYKQSTDQLLKGIAINTASTTKVMLDGAPSAISSLVKEDHFIAAFIVPACAGNGSTSGIPATLVAAWSPGSSHFAATGDHHGDRHHDGWKTHHHRGDHHGATKK